MSSLTVSAVILIALVSILHRAEGFCSDPPPITKKFCRNPPLANQIDISSYTGRWFQIYTAGTSANASGNRCVTANYTLTPSSKLKVLNCQQAQGETRAQCVKARASPSKGASPAKLKLRYGGGQRLQYNIAALLGDKTYGYFAAAVYNCRETPDGIKQGFFVIARSPFNPLATLNLLKEKLKCMGYTLEDRFELSKFDSDCNFFDMGNGFDVVSPPPM